MDPEFSNCSSSTIDSIRRAGISRRGGVKVRGGRLPPVQIQSVIAKKKVVAPKIPQRRLKIKQEATCDTNTFEQSYSNLERNFQGSRGRGRGRGNRVYIQTQGTLLGDGPAMRIKKEREYASYERTSIPRSSKNSACDFKIEESIIERLLNSSNEETELYDEYENDLIPMKYPYSKLRIKKEIKTDFDTEDIKPFIKVEPGESPPKDNRITLEGKFFTRIKNASLPVVNDLMADIKKTEEGKSIMFLLQFPSCLPYEILSDTENDKKKTPVSKMNVGDEKEKLNENFKKTHLREIPEGHLGKLQVLKSGKMRLIIGSVQISVEEGTTPEHLCEVVSMPVEEKGGDVIVLGRIERKIILKPHFADMRQRVTFN